MIFRVRQQYGHQFCRAFHENMLLCVYGKTLSSRSQVRLTWVDIICISITYFSPVHGQFCLMKQASFHTGLKSLHIMVQLIWYEINR